MVFNSLKEKCYFYRDLAERKLMPNSYILLMLDGRSFSSKIKKNFELPFDNDFVEMMNLTARYLCKNISGAQFAFVQSDEISILVSDSGAGEGFFQNRYCKILSIASAMATSKFNQLMMAKRAEEKPMDRHDVLAQELYEFDCKAWNVPSKNDVFAWFLFRQNDCIRNSKQQAAQTYLSHKRLLNLPTEAQISLLKQEKGIDWHNYPSGLKYGRIIVKNAVVKTNEKTGDTYTRNVWEIKDAPILFMDDEREMLKDLIPDLQ